MWYIHFDGVSSSSGTSFASDIKTQQYLWLKVLKDDYKEIMNFNVNLKVNIQIGKLKCKKSSVLQAYYQDTRRRHDVAAKS